MSWQKRSRQIQREIANYFEIPNEIILDLPKITMVGDVQLQVENHKGIVVYQPDLIIVRVNEGELKIDGKSLRIRSIGTETICIEGKLKALAFEKGMER